jgi:cell division protein FtsB
LTGRATALGLVLGALLLAYAYPVRIYLNQQAQIAAMENNQAAQRRHIGQLTDDAANYSDRTFIQSEATRRLGMVMPGETLYHVSWPGSAVSTTPSGATASKVKDTGPWYGQLWSSMQAADKSRTTP